MSKVVIVRPNTLNEIIDLMNSNKKIAAIKCLRAAKPDLRLKELKQTIERFWDERTGRGASLESLREGHQLTIRPVIEKVVCNFEGSSMEVDIQTLQMKILTSLETIGLDACSEMLHVVDVLNALNAGKEVRVVEKEII